jgi:hypothetical protein
MTTRTDPGKIYPTDERLAHSLIERHKGTVADVRGAIGDPFMAVGTLEAMLRRKAISPEMHRAGNQFHVDFHAAHLDPLRAPDLDRTPVSGSRPSTLPSRIVNARQSVWEALLALGGIASPSGSLAWGVLGEGHTLDEWGKVQGWRQRPIHRNVVSGILIGTLGVLIAHYGLLTRRASMD